MYDRFNGRRAVGTPVEVTLEELADALYCTPRNAKLILRKLADDHLIEWSPGRGRGNRSRLSFKADKEPLLLELSRGLAQRGDYKQSFELLNEFGHDSSAKPKFLDWLNGHFGYQQEKLEGATASDILRFPVYRPVVSLDPAQVNYAFDAHLVRQIYDRLVRFDEKLERIVPGIAHHWTSNEEGTEWTFYLRKGVLFHDGRELTSVDAAFTFERLAGDTPNRWLMRGVAAVEPRGPRVLRFRLHRPNRIFDRFMCSAAASILPKDLAGREEADFWQLPIGSGPFRLAALTPHLIELASFANYYAGRAYLDGVQIVIMPEDCLTDPSCWPEVLHTFDTDPSEDEKKPDENWQRLIKLCRGCTMVTWNLNRLGPQQSEAFRRAVRMILHPPAMIEDLGGERALPAASFRPEVSASLPIGAYDPKRIRAALRESGYDGAVLRFGAHEKYETDANWIANRLAEWGINTEIVVTTWDQVTDSSCIQETDFTISGVVFAEDEVCEIEHYEHGACIVQSFLDEERLDWILNRIDAALTADAAGRRLLLREIEDRLRDEAVILFLHHRQLNTYHHPSLRGVSLNSLGWIDFQNLWFEKNA
ncbi:ABC transporter substrate-binding protein [Cohnella thermotolerans]|uniref:ABC transporter substrate-binding protein n=1 Tax=Cohnella thermotolerans TaxID=329858 RepID=UPI000554647B